MTDVGSVLSVKMTSASSTADEKASCWRKPVKRDVRRQVGAQLGRTPSRVPCDVDVHARGRAARPRRGRRWARRRRRCPTKRILGRPVMGPAGSTVHVGGASWTMMPRPPHDSSKATQCSSVTMLASTLDASQRCGAWRRSETRSPWAPKPPGWVSRTIGTPWRFAHQYPSMPGSSGGLVTISPVGLVRAR